MKLSQYKYFINALIFILIQGCANQLPPGGGEIDLIPPEIVEVYPAEGTINYNEDYIEIGFSEYVDKRTVLDAIFISPALEGRIELDWSGRYVRILFPEKLRENTTYVVTIGTDVVDFNNRNRMAESYSLTFSTGPLIDKRVITGKIFDANPEGILIYAYKSFADTINPSVTKPDYISQTGTDGRYKMGGLAAGTYRLFAVDDDFRDLLFQPEQDRIGIPFNDVVLGVEDTLFSGMNFFLSQIDTIPPGFISAAMTDNNHILVVISEPIDSTIIRADNFYIYDSTSNRRSELLYAYKGETKADELILVTSDTFGDQNDVYLFADTLMDISGNIFRNEVVELNISDRPDTTKPFISSAEPRPGSAASDFLNQRFEFKMNDAVDSSLLKNKITFTDTLNNAVPYNISFVDDAFFIITPVSNLEPSTDYIISMDFNDVPDAAGNMTDSVYTYNFRTISGLDFTGAAGKIINYDLSRNPILILQPAKAGGNTYTLNVTGPTFEFKRVRSGEYILWGFFDEDSSGTYTTGNYSPFNYAEEFSNYPDTLNLRPRWTVTDIQFNFNSE